MNLKKFVLINLILLAIVLGSVEFFNYNIYKSKYMDLLILQSKNCDNPEKALKDSLPKYSAPRLYDFKKHRDPIKFVIQGTSDKLPIITIGCSYSYGILLNRRETLAGQLNKVTERTVYNLGQSGTGPQILYEQLADESLKKEIPDAEYVIYVFLHNHIMRQFMRLFSNSSIINPVYYIDKNGNLKKEKPVFPKLIYSSFIVKNYLENKVLIEKEKAEIANGLPLFLKTMEESVKIMKEKYPNSKFVLMEFPQAPMCRADYQEKTQELTDKDIKNLEKLGIIYINAEQLVGHKYRDVKKYRIADQDHPNAKVWEEIAPALKKRLNL